MIDVVATAQQASACNMHGVTAVVVDVLRATTTMTVALHNGARRIIAVRTPDEAFAIKHSSTDDVLLGGERNADMIAGFDLDNSPRRYSSDIVRGKSIVMTTTNGTQAINACSDAKRILIASFLNVQKTIEQLSDDDEIVIVCSGTEGHFTMEDGLCAGCIVSHLHGSKSDFAIAMQQLYMASLPDVRQMAFLGEHYNRLLSKGYAGDLDVCFNFSCNYNAIECVGNEIFMLN